MATNNVINAPIPFAIAQGGTAVTSVTTGPAATAWAGWDANKNLSANSFISGYATTATGATTTTLVVGSAWQQFFTGSTTQTVVLPVTSTLVLGQSFYIVNNSSGVVTVQSSGANTIQAMAANTTLLVTCILTSGTTAASWATEYVGAASGGTVNSGTTGQVAYYATSTNAVSGGTLQNITGIATNATSAAGKVGEIVQSVIAAASGTNLTNNTAVNVTSISLTAGDWNIWGNVTITALSVGATSIFGWISTVSATVPDSSVYSGGLQTINSDTGLTVPSYVLQLSGTTTVYLTMLCGFTGTAKGCGRIYARRVT